MRDMTIYLAGYISGEVLEQCLSWRKKIREFYDDWKGQGIPYPINWLDPVNGENYAEISKDGLTSNMPSNAIVHKDYLSVVKSDLIIANLSTFGCLRPAIGTISEITIAWTEHKPVVLITDEEMYKNHPFLKYFSSWIVDTVDELLSKKIINEFYKSWHTAIY